MTQATLKASMMLICSSFSSNPIVLSPVRGFDHFVNAFSCQYNVIHGLMTGGEKKHRRLSVSLCTLLLSALGGWQRISRARSLLGCLLLLGQALHELLLLGQETLLSALTCLLRLGTTSFSLVTVGRAENQVLIQRSNPNPQHISWFSILFFNRTTPTYTGN